MLPGRAWCLRSSPNYISSLWVLLMDLLTSYQIYPSSDVSSRACALCVMAVPSGCPPSLLSSTWRLRWCSAEDWFPLRGDLSGEVFGCSKLGMGATGTACVQAGNTAQHLVVAQTAPRPVSQAEEQAQSVSSWLPPCPALLPGLTCPLDCSFLCA